MRDLDKLIVPKDFKKLPKVQKIAQSGHTAASTMDLRIPSTFTLSPFLIKCFFLKMAIPGLFSFIFVFSNQHYNSFNKYM